MSTHIIHLELHTEAARVLNKKLVIFAMYLDFERAFDKVWHSRVIYKLNTCELAHLQNEFVMPDIVKWAFEVKTHCEHHQFVV